MAATLPSWHVLRRESSDPGLDHEVDPGHSLGSLAIAIRPRGHRPRRTNLVHEGGTGWALPGRGRIRALHEDEVEDTVLAGSTMPGHQRWCSILPLPSWYRRGDRWAQCWPATRSAPVLGRPEQLIRDQAVSFPHYRCQCRCQPSASTSAPANALAARSLVTTPGASRSIAAATRESTPDPHAANVLWWR